MAEPQKETPGTQGQQRPTVRGGREQRERRPRGDRRPREQDEFENEVIDLRRVAKVVKGGKNLSFRATVVIGDKNGRVGIGKGNKREVPVAIQMAIRDAKRNLIRIPLNQGTIPHEVIGKFKASRVLLKPAFPGTGVIAGRTVGAICRMAGIRDILTKARQSTNPLTLAKATMEGLGALKTLEDVAKMRDKKPEEVAA
ncbi:30S ribosomal protein S5 [Candidatus Acetothermia bacterium]|nr:30S ribosomal protein S5 [Candidatus Acetothermia bacterium]MBI3659197.1 30S ribosomal protein S5 [Candidatus Acetothermia bacterium]